jgi:hypothetical protein
MPTTKTVAGQTWIDMCLQTFGDEIRLFDLCDLNNAGITDDLPDGSEIQIAEPDLDKILITSLLNTLKPSSLYYGTGNPAPGGIEYWAIEIDFEVS